MSTGARWNDAALPPEPEDIPPALSWDDYVPLAQEEWRTLLGSPDLDEPRVLDFLTKNPAFVPGARGFGGGHHGAIHSVLFVEAQLPGIRRPIPDFMWVVRDTEAVRPICIEIESPTKRWFKKSGLATDELQHAIRQLSEWRQFFENQANVINFRDLYALNGTYFGHRPLKPTYCLVYGRQNEFEGRDDLLTTRRGMRPDNTAWMTFDSLQPDDYAHDVFSVKVHVDRRWEALQAAPTLRFGNRDARDFSLLSGRDDAIRRNVYMTSERQEFLVSRLPVWDGWQAKHITGPQQVRWE